MRPYCSLLMILACLPIQAKAADAPYYGPMKAWHGIGFKFGYKDKIEDDGTWRVDATVRQGEAVDMAMYRAAEIAREQGYAYLELLGGFGRRGPGMDSATVYARPSRSAASPTACRSKRQGTCYTADVGEMLRILGGAGGTQPGVAITDHVDEYGRQVVISGFGTGAASLAAPRSVPLAPSTALPPPPAAIARSMSNRRPPTAEDRFQQALKAVQPMTGRDESGRWTISD